MEDCDLCDLRHHGDFFTWSNIYASLTFTTKRLDYAVANKDWTENYNAVRVESLISWCSDHKPLLATSKHFR